MENKKAEEYINLGKSLRREGKNDLAIKEFEKARKIISKDDIFLKNMILNEIEIIQRKSILKSKPQFLTVLLTNKCNLKCKMCGVRCEEKFDITKKRSIEIEKLFPYLQNIVWTGGEVFLSRYFRRLFDKASTYKHLQQMILTNGLLINKKWAKKLARSNVLISYSIDGATKKTYESIRGKGKFKNLIKRIKLLNKYRQRYNSKIKIGIQFTVMKTNYHEIEKMLDFAKKYEFNFIRFYPVLGLNDTENIFHQNDSEAANYLEKIRPKLVKKASKYKIRLDYQLPSLKNFDCYKDQFKEPRRTEIVNKCIKNLKKNILCYYPWQKMHIQNNRVRAECYCLRDIGDLKKNSLEEIWNGKNMQIYRKKIAKNRFDWCDYKCILNLIPWIHES